MSVVIDVAIAQLAAAWEIENGVGEYWWVSVLKALGGGSEKNPSAQRSSPPQNIRWF